MNATNVTQEVVDTIISNTQFPIDIGTVKVMAILAVLVILAFSWKEILAIMMKSITIILAFLTIIIIAIMTGYLKV